MILFSLFIIWHVIGISLVGPLYDNDSDSLIIRIYKPYLNLFHLDQNWPFYSPTPHRGSIMRYQVIHQDGEKRTLPLTEARDRYDHAFSRYSNYYVYLFQDPKYTRKWRLDVSAANFLCSKHKNYSISVINFILLKQKKFSREDYLHGKHPMDAEFLEERIFGPYDCTKINSLQ